MQKELSKDSAVYFSSFIIQSIIGILSIPIITNLVSPDQYGSYVLILSTANLLAMISTGWIGASILRYYNRYQDGRPKNFNTSIFILAAVASLLSLAMAALFLLFDHGFLSTDLLLLGLLLFLGIAWYNMVGYFPRARQHVMQFTLVKILNNILGILLGIGLCTFYKMGIDGLLWGLVVSNYLSFFLLSFFSKLGFTLSHIQESVGIGREVVRYGLPLILVNAMSWMLVWSDRYILGLLKDNIQVGIYSASYALADKSMVAIVTVFKLAALPIAFKIWETKSKVESQVFVGELARFFLLVCMPLLALLNVLAEPIVQIMTEQQYHEGYKIIPFISIGSFLFGLQVLYSIGLSFYQKTKWIMYYNALAIIINVFLNIIYIPRFGYMAAAASTFVTYLLMFVISVFASRRFFTWTFPIASFVRIGLAALFMSLTIQIIFRLLSVPVIVSLLLAMAGGLVSYVASLIYLGELKIAEIYKILRA
ncbi:hypothetical protein EH223_07990 [candidate division KSB1 bacterium]|nr:oligosaccharide flippase family protein [candidate division KSB1 bacterium]RQW04133.1 MAG: hypothetical protein EH223_07990 [candidate division KSB1 bacterium]